MGEPTKMMGIVKKIDAHGFGIIDGTDGFKIAFIPSDVMKNYVLTGGKR
jgi:hypothetical protein